MINKKQMVSFEVSIAMKWQVRMAMRMDQDEKGNDNWVSMAMYSEQV